MGKKYIIELEDENYHQYSDSEPSDYLWRVKGFNALVFDEVGISKLTPYTEPDLERVRKEAYQKGYETGYEDGYNEPGKNQQEAYQRGLSDAWDAARKFMSEVIDARFRNNFMVEIFRWDNAVGAMKVYSASEAIEKIRQYKQEKDAEIKVGNEVKAFEKKPFIVTGFGYGDDGEDVYCHGFVTENGISTSAKKNSCVRTGRHFPELVAILEKMKNESNEQIDT